jgi:hypothetical protein
MNYKTIFMLAAMTVAAAFVAIGSATPIFETAFTQNINNNPDSVGNQIDDSCNGANTGDCRCGQIGQNNQSGDNTIEGDLNFN